MAPRKPWEPGTRRTKEARVSPVDSWPEAVWLGWKLGAVCQLSRPVPSGAPRAPDGAALPVTRSCWRSRPRCRVAGEIANRLYISPKTADHHIQHVYAKTGVSTRAATMLWAMQHGVVG
jgi:hypothetical protein